MVENMNILISVNSNYLDKAKTMLYSVYVNTKECITVYLLNHSLLNDELIEFNNFLHKKCKAKLSVIDVKKTELDNLPIGDLNFSIEMYYRLLAQFFLPEKLDRILWLDADIIVLKDIKEFYNTNFDGKEYIVCQDMCDGKQWVNEVKNKLGLSKDNKYFNSGVLLINLELLRHSSDMQMIVNKCMSMRDVLTYPDQDILNVMYCNRVKYVEPQKFNYQLSGAKDIDKKTIKDVVILHYTGKNKPWFYWNINKASKFYWRMRFKQGGSKLEVIKSYSLYYYDKIIKALRKNH